jgi:hypothetical protein
MSSNMLPLIELAILAAVIVVALLVTRRVRTKLKGPFGTGLDLDASNPGIHAKKRRARRAVSVLTTAPQAVSLRTE